MKKKKEINWEAIGSMWLPLVFIIVCATALVVGISRTATQNQIEEQGHIIIGNFTTITVAPIILIDCEWLEEYDYPNKNIMVDGMRDNIQINLTEVCNILK